jgi:nitrite reductase/ring-hydroxylating ferredoxin subunit
VTWHRVLEAADLRPGVPAGVEVDGRAVCVVRLPDGALTAFDDACPHRAWPLHQGRLEGVVLTCKAHTWQWDVRDGSLRDLRAPECLTMHAVREQDGAIEVAVAADAPPAPAISPLYLRAAAREAAA